MRSCEGVRDVGVNHRREVPNNLGVGHFFGAGPLHADFFFMLANIVQEKDVPVVHPLDC